MGKAHASHNRISETLIIRGTESGVPGRSVGAPGVPGGNLGQTSSRPYHGVAQTRSMPDWWITVVATSQHFPAAPWQKVARAAFYRRPGRRDKTRSPGAAHPQWMRLTFRRLCHRMHCLPTNMTEKVLNFFFDNLLEETIALVLYIIWTLHFLPVFNTAKTNPRFGECCTCRFG